MSIEWKSTNILPEINVDVLCYYTIGENEYYCIGRIESITTVDYGKESVKSIDWIDKEHNVINPIYWAHINPPSGEVA